MKTKHDNLLKICEQKFKYLNYSDRTKEAYMYYIKQFLKRVDKYHQHLVASDFQNYLDGYRFTSVSQQNQVINAIRFLYKYGLQKQYGKVSFKRPKTEKKLPMVIDQELIKSKLKQIRNLKHKAILTLAYSVGLRVSEVLNLKISDIDSARMVINIRNAKGRKDRIVPLSENVLQILRNYYRKFTPADHLFEGQSGGRYSSTSCNCIFKKHIDRRGHFHTLRHSSFTSMLENGTDLRLIQKIAGHNSSRTTEIYTHISNKILQTAALPA